MMALVTIGCAIGADIACGLLYALAEHTGTAHALYCAVGNAVTEGACIAPVTPAGHWINIAEFLTVVPLFAATFSLFTSGLAAAHVRLHTATIEKRITKDADERHVIMQKHVERLLTGHCADIKDHMSAAVQESVQKAAQAAAPATAPRRNPRSKTGAAP